MRQAKFELWSTNLCKKTARQSTYTVFLYNSWSVKTPPSILHFVVCELLPFLMLLRGISGIFIHAVGEHVRVEVNLRASLPLLKCSSNSSWIKMKSFLVINFINLPFLQSNICPSPGLTEMHISNVTVIKTLWLEICVFKSQNGKISPL